MRNITFLIIVIFAFVYSSCDKDEDDVKTIVGTAWFGTGNDEGEVISFLSATNFSWTGGEISTVLQGSYTFDGTSGILTIVNDDPYNFTISGDILIVDNGDESTYVKQ